VNRNSLWLTSRYGQLEKESEQTKRRLKTEVSEIQTNNIMAKSSGLKNAPSTSGNKSGSGRGNNAPSTSGGGSKGNSSSSGSKGK
jgi:hypothetical protein